MQKALKGFMLSNNSQFPTDLAQLQPYFASPMDPAILDRWQIAPGKAVPSVGVGDMIITQKAPVDDVFDMRLVIGSGGGSGSTGFFPQKEVNQLMRTVYEGYRAAHNGEYPADPAELQPYISTPEQQAALEKLILRHSISN
jgi:hypothetical protein